MVTLFYTLKLYFFLQGHETIPQNEKIDFANSIRRNIQHTLNVQKQYHERIRFFQIF